MKLFNEYGQEVKPVLIYCEHNINGEFNGGNESLAFVPASTSQQQLENLSASYLNNYFKGEGLEEFIEPIENLWGAYDVEQIAELGE